MDRPGKNYYRKQANVDMLLGLLVKVKKKGHRVDFMNGLTQLRVDGCVDLYPSTKRYRNIKTKINGCFTLNLESIERVIG